MGRLFSIIIPTFNSKNYVGECVRSALNQSYPNVEVIVDDNTSKDGTCELLEKEFGDDQRFKLFRNQEDLNIPLGWSRSFRRMTGDFGLLLHSDNVLHPQYVESVMQLTEQYPANVVYSESLYFEGETPTELFPPADLTKVKLAFLSHGPRAIEYIFHHQRMIPTSSLAIHKSCLEGRSPYDPKFKWDPDIEQMVWLAERYDVLHLQLPLVGIRTHGGQAPSWKDPTFSEQYRTLLEMAHTHGKTDAHHFLIHWAYSNQDVCEKLGKLKGVKFSIYRRFLEKWLRAEWALFFFFAIQFARKVKLMGKYTLNWMRFH